MTVDNFFSEILGFGDNRDQLVDFQTLRKNDFVGLIEKRPSGVPSVDGCHTIYSPTLSSALSSAESIAFAA
jgi:hypothetical protein